MRAAIVLAGAFLLAFAPLTAATPPLEDHVNRAAGVVADAAEGLPSAGGCQVVWVADVMVWPCVFILPGSHCYYAGMEWWANGYHHTYVAYC